jgi:hypothetical protein
MVFKVTFAAKAAIIARAVMFTYLIDNKEFKNA